MKAECPYCQHDNRLIYVPEHNYPQVDELMEFDCKSCGEPFLFEVKIRIDIETYKLEKSGAV